MKSALISALALVLVSFGWACGGSANTGAPPQTPAKESPPPKAEGPKVEKEAAPAKPDSPPVQTPPAAEAAAEPCDPGWVCVKVDLATRKIEKRATKLIGDPKIDQTYSKTTDGRGPVGFDFFSKGKVELMLRRKPGNKAEITIKPPSGPEIVVDQHEGNDFTYIGAIAAEQAGTLLIDLRYMK